MSTSETTGAIAAALAAAQAEFTTVTKTSSATVPTKSGGKYTYTYANLADVSAAVLPILARHGLSFTCLPEPGERGWIITGTLLHESGEQLTAWLPLYGATPQEIGSSLTYMRRYLLGAITGVVTDDDDDGSAAQTDTPLRHQKQRPAAPDPSVSIVDALAADGRDWGREVAGCGSVDALRGLWEEARAAGALTHEVQELLMARRSELDGARPPAD